VIDQNLPNDARRELMEQCGRHCIGASTLQKASRMQRESANLDELLERLNAARIGGGHLRREGSRIHAVYEQCYCGSVSQSKTPISITYCYCSCGWFRQLFETLLGKPVEVELVESIQSGGDGCRFIIHLPPI
jgi:predicted hydrocarbon binding protein